MILKEVSVQGVRERKREREREREGEREREREMLEEGGADRRPIWMFMDAYSVIHTSSSIAVCPCGR